ncbi:outer membrane beta-barrel protein [uncultured Lacinutrix sp.]|uniref:outer membrane beta-barrel protein n=1 Tax=uncultured Lacinutrix sp. TaxID=574032 RepID=UPI0026070ECF|nr:outer membrane beta-barrel protein [uncultured Lacinutrix sp.]
MKKVLFGLIFLFSIAISKAQDLSYGVILGANIYNDQFSSGGPNDVFFDSGNGDFVVPNLGAYFEYGFNKNIGVKLELSFNKKSFEKGFANASLDEIYNLSYIDINPNFKYDFGEEYRRGFYMLLGPKFALLSKAEFNGKDVKSDFENMSIGLELAIGQRFLKFLEAELKFDYGLTPFFKFEGSKSSKLSGAYFSINIDIDRVINPI